MTGDQQLMLHPYQISMQFSISCTFTFSAVRVRGGSPLEKDVLKIPELDAKNFKWSGHPLIDFNERVLYPLQAGLASITQKDVSLLDVALEVSPGSIGGVPNAGVASPQILAEENSRRHKLFGVILNYIDERSNIYIEYILRFQRNGVFVYNHMIQYGPLAIPQEVTNARNHVWNVMTMENMRYSFTLSGYFLWLNYVLKFGRKLGKNGNEMRDKFVKGLPAWFDSEKVNMLRIININIPATYAGSAYPYPPGMAGNAMPNAGEPDTEAISRSYVSNWVSKSAIHGKNVQSGNINFVAMEVCEEVVPDMANSTSDFPALHPPNVENANLLSKDVTPKTKCNYCGGDGHATSQILPSGEKIFCTSWTLGNKPMSSGKSTETRLTKYKAVNEAQELKIEELTEMLSVMQNTIANMGAAGGSRSNSRRTFSRGQPRQANLSDLSGSEATDTDHNNDALDDVSEASSMGSEVNASEFADAISKKRLTKRR